MALHKGYNPLHALLPVHEYLCGMFLLIPVPIQDQPAVHSHGAVHHFHTGIQYIPDLLCQFHLPHLFHGGDVITVILPGSTKYHFICHLQRIIQVQQGESMSPVGRYLPRAQCLPAHLKTGICLHPSLFRYPVDVVEPKNHCVQLLVLPVVDTDLLPLGQGQGLETHW